MKQYGTEVVVCDFEPEGAQEQLKLILAALDRWANELQRNHTNTAYGCSLDANPSSSK